MTFEASPSAISSQASESGPTLSVEPDGQTTFLHGLDPVPASPSAPLASNSASPTNGTFGPCGSSSSASAVLQSSLESRLRARSTGSILYRLTWKARTTPSGRAICALRGSRGRTYASAFILSGWPTPCVVEPNTSPEKVWERKQRLTASTGVYRGNDCGLGSKVQLAGWPTPMAGTPAQNGNNEAGNTDASRRTVALCPTQYAIRGKLTRDGRMSIGCCAETLPENQAGGPLSPEHSRWLMELPAGWASCAPTETRSTRKPPRSSAEP